MKQDKITSLESFTWDILLKRILQYEMHPEKVNDQISQEILIQFYNLCHLDDPFMIGNTNNLFNHFEILKVINDKESERLLTRLMEEKGISYPFCIREATIRLMEQPNDHLDGLSPMVVPGVNKISKDGELYQLDTKIGTIHIRKASDVFKNTKSSHIFERKLSQECYARSLEFLKANQDSYRVVLSYLPTLFTEGYYHAFLTNGTEVLDIASNTFYPDKREAMEMFHGNTLGVLSYEEVTKMEQSLLEQMGFKEKFPHNHKVLHLIAHYLHAKQKV